MENGYGYGHQRLRLSHLATQVSVLWSLLHPSDKVDGEQIRGLASHPPVGFRPKRWGIAIAFAACSLIAISWPAAADLNDPGGPWDIDANGFSGTLKISVDVNGNLTGTVFGNPLTGFYDKASGRIMFVRIITSSEPRNNQVYTGYFMQDAVPAPGQAFVYHFAGSFEVFSGGGGTAKRNVYAWYATYTIKTPA